MQNIRSAGVVNFIEMKVAGTEFLFINFFIFMKNLFKLWLAGRMFGGGGGSRGGCGCLGTILTIIIIILILGMFDLIPFDRLGL